MDQLDLKGKEEQGYIVKDRFEFKKLNTEYTTVMEREGKGQELEVEPMNLSKKQIKVHRKRILAEYTREVMNTELVIKLRLEKSYKKGKERTGKKVDNFMKLMSSTRFLEIAYQKIKGNKGTLTEGVDKSTSDEGDKVFFRNLSDKLREGNYQWKPVRRIYIDKPGKKVKRPRGITTFESKVVQEAIRILLNVIYEPEFQELETNYGFRPGRSVEMAVNKIRYENKGMTTAIEGDIN